MCGIAGLVMRKGAPSERVLSAMQERLLHRGPDSQGRHFDGSVALAHTRLSIIDLQSGRQPMFGAGGEHCLIANAEIYNFPSLRAELESQGCRFNTNSDCEVILPLYARDDRDCVRHLRGMFAFALWDRSRRKLILARDRMGEKPLYYAFNDKHFVFASELRAILSSGLVSRNLDHREIARYFRYQYVPEPNTPFGEIHKAPAGCTLELDLDSWNLDLRTYWSPWEAPPLEGDPKALIRRDLEDAIRIALASDVPIGLSLSGGIDSSILAFLMKRYAERPVHAISIGYPNAKKFDERPQAKALADRLGLIFHSVEIDDQTMLASFSDLVAQRDDPIGDISGYCYYAIMEHARKNGIKVMLQGHGLDELCWGYPWVKDAAALNLKSAAAAPPQGLGDQRPVESTAVPHGFRMFELQPFTQWVISHAPNMFTRDFFESSRWGEMTPRQEYGGQGLRGDLEVTRLIVDFYLRENGIAQGDRLSMANSVEMRLPFVDHKLVETIIGLRKAEPDHQFPLKYWLKQSVDDLLPAEILNRPKSGFAPPVLRWQAALRLRYGYLLREGFLVREGIMTRRYAERLARPEISEVLETIVSRLALTLELWGRSVVWGQPIQTD